MSQQELDSLDANILRVQQSTKTLFPTFTRAHNWLRMKSGVYYNWHLNPFHTAIHVFVLLAYVLNVGALSYHLANTVPAVLASGPTTYDLADSNNFNVRLDGAAEGDQLGIKGIRTADFNGNGKNDLIIGAYYTDHNLVNNSGSVYVVFDFEDKNLTGTGNLIDFADTSNYNLRFDGTHTNSFGTGETTIAAIGSDYNGDNKEDLLIFMAGTNELGTNVGSVYLISSDILTASSGTGNAFRLADSSSYTLRINGPVALDVFGGLGNNHELTDIDGDGKNDLLVSSPGMDNNAAQTGSVYVISSTILDDYTGTGNTLDITDTSKFNIRFDGEATAWSLAIGPVLATDINGNGKNDLIMGNGWADSKAAVSTNNAGTVHIIYDDLLRSHSGTGNVVDLANHDTWNVRIDGAASGDQFSAYSLAIADIDGDGKPDLAAGSNVSDNNSRTDSGSVWIISNTLITSLSGTGNILDLAVPSSYSIRLDGAVAGDALSYNNVAIADFNNDGKNDLLTGAHRADHNSRTDSGSAYFMDSSVLRSYSGTGNLIDMSDTSKYSIRWDAAAAGDRVTTLHKNMEDYNGDGIGDLVLDSYSSNFNSHNDSGSIYIVYNFPHSIAAPTVVGESTSANRTVTGSIAASSSITNINAVQASVNTATFSGTWTDCTATDGAFDSKTESYSCNLALPSEGTHTVRIRAKDSNGVYTPVSRYKSVSAIYTVPQPSPSAEPSPEVTVTPADTTAPTVTLASITGTRVRSTLSHFTYASKTPRPIFAGSAEAGAKVVVRVGDEVLCETTATSSGSWSCTSKQLEFKEYAVEISATDAANNQTKLPAFTLKVVEQLEGSPSPELTATTTGEVAGEGIKVEISQDPSLTSSGTTYTPNGLVPYATTVSLNGEQLRLSHFKLRVLNRAGEPLAEAPVTLNSTPQTSITDKLGVATFGNVPVGQHTLSYIHKGVKVSLPIEIAVAADVMSSIESGSAVQVTLAPVEIHLPIAQFGLITVAWILVLILTTAVSGYFGYRHAGVLFPQWRLASAHQLINIQAFDEEINRVQDSTKTTWPIFARLHNWLRMHSRTYYWWHLLPRHKYWVLLSLIVYIVILAFIMYRAWMTF